MVLFTLVSCEVDEGDDGTCSMEKPTCGDIGGGEEEEKQKYGKLQWTNDQDYVIRVSLDKADALIANHPRDAMEIYNDLLREHPSSPRANYALAKAHQVVAMNITEKEDPERKEACDTAFGLCRKIVNFPRENTTDIMRTLSHKCLLELSETVCNDKNNFIEALYLYTRENEESKGHHKQLAYELFFAKRYEETMEQIDKVVQQFNDTQLLVVIKVSPQRGYKLFTCTCIN